jgi:Ca2+-binding RTX toxin-like protein
MQRMAIKQTHGELKMATVNGTSGNDELFGFSTADTINGFAGNDQMFGDAGNDTLCWQARAMIPLLVARVMTP